MRLLYLAYMSVDVSVHVSFIFNTPALSGRFSAL